MKNHYFKLLFASLLLFSGGSASAQLTAACSPTYTNNDASHFMTSFTLGSFSHSPVYNVHNYTAQSFTVNAGGTYSIAAISSGFCGVATAADFNNDGDFADAGELLTYPAYVASSPATYNFSITIPPSVLTGAYRFRIFNRGANSGDGTPSGSACGAYTYGSWVDYTMNVVNTATCQPPTAITVTGTNSNSTTVSWTASTSTPLGYFWKVVTTGSDPNLVAGTSGYTTGLTAAVSGLTALTGYQVYVKSVCSSVDSSAWALPAAINTTCAGAPTVGVASSTPSGSVCSGVNFTLSLTGASVGTGITYQWQSTPFGTTAWANITTATSINSTVNQTASTSYRAVVTCTGSTLSDTSNLISLTMNAPSTCYCVPVGTNSNYFIDSFSTTGGSTNISNGSTGFSTGGYGVFTAKTVTQNLGSPVSFYGKYGGTNTFGTRIWVDWNQNGVLDDAGEVVYSSSTYANNQSGTFSVPATALPGATRMRVGISYTPSTGPATPCLTNLSGEYEDYTFIVTVPTCVLPSGLTSSNVTATTATISWTAAAPAPANGYEYYQSTTNTPPTAATVATGSVAAGVLTKNITGLTQSTTYYYWVRSVCSTLDKSDWTASIAVVTLTPGQIGVGTATNSNLPIYTCYGYNYSQQIYLASELSATIPVGNTYITKVRFNQTSAASTSANYNNWTVYMGNTAKTAFANNTDWVPATGLSQVYSGVLSALSGPGWVEITLSNPFTWDGTSNIVVGVDENSPSYSCTSSWASFTASANRGILYYNDVTNPDPLSPPAANYGPTSSIAQVQFEAIVQPPPSCLTAPTFPANNGGFCLSTTPATLTWPAVIGATSYNLYLNSGATATTLIGNFTTTSYTTPAALATGNYAWKIVPVNAIGSATGCSTFSFTVYGLPTAPTATNSAQCGPQVPTASVASTAGVNGSGTFNWYDAATAGNLVQGQAYTATATTWYSDDYSNATPTATATLGGAAAISGGALVLQPTVTSSGGNIVINASGANASKFNTDFDLTLNSTGGSIADGLSYSFGDDVVGLTATTTPTAEKGSGSKLRLLFMTYNNSGNNAKGVYLVYNTTATDFTATTAGVLAYSNNTSWIPNASGSLTTHISLAIGADGKANVMLGTTPLFTNIQLPAAYLAENKATWKHAISSRSGGVAGGFAIDNVVLQKNTPMVGYTTYQQPVATTTTFYVSETSPGGCESPRTPVTITVNSAPTISVAAPTAICLGQTATAVASSTNPTYTYSWTPGSLTGASQSLTPTTTTTYVVSANDMTTGNPFSGCSTSATFTLNVNPAPTVNLGNDTAICAGSTLTLNAGAANSTFTKLWSNAATTQTINVTTAGTYSVTVNNGSCSKSDTIVVSVNALPVVNLGADTAICAGSTLTLSAGAANSSYTKLWSNLATTQTIPVTTAGTYSVKVTNGTCSKSDTIVVSVNALPVVNLGADTAICAGSTLTLNAGAANSTYTKLWSNLATTQTIPVTTAGTYSVKVTNGTCAKSDTIVVTVNAIPVVNLGADTTICANLGLTLNAGNAGATYLWSNNSTNQTLNVTAAGTYSVKVSNGNCSANDTIMVSNVPLPSADSITVSNDAGCTFTFGAANAQNVLTYNWDFGGGSSSSQANPTHTFLAPGTYPVVLTLVNSCGDSVTLNTSVTCQEVGIKGLDLGIDALKLYPNPAQQLVTVENVSELKMKQIKITNILGQEVARIAVTKQAKQTINVANLAAGLYNVTIEFEEGSVNRKLEILK